MATAGMRPRPLQQTAAAAPPPPDSMTPPYGSAHTVDGVPMYPVVTTVAGSGRHGFVDGHATREVYLDDPLDLCLLPDESVLIADSKNNCLRRLSLAAGTVTTLVTHAFLGPRCPVVIDGGAAVVVADSGHHKVRMLQFVRDDGSTVADGRPLGAGVTDVSIAGCGRQGFVDGAADTAAFNRPVGLAVIHDGSILVADAGNHAIRRIAARPGKPGLVVTTVVGAAGVPGCADGDSGSGRLRGPTAIVMDRAGTIIIADTGNAALRALHPPADGDLSGAGWLLTTLAGGADDPGFVDGDAAPASRWRAPLRLAVGADDDLLVSDAGNHAVRAVVAGGGMGPATGLFALDLAGRVRAAPTGAPTNAAAAVERAATRHKSLLSLAVGDVAPRAPRAGAVPDALTLDMTGAAPPRAGAAGGSSGAPRPRRTIVVPSSLLVGAYATAAGSSGASDDAVDDTMTLASPPPPGAPHGVPAWLAATIRRVVAGDAEHPQPRAATARVDGDDDATLASLAALAGAATRTPPPASPFAVSAAAYHYLPGGGGGGGGSGGSGGSGGGGGSDSAPDITVVVYDDLERVLAAHRRYSRVATVAGATPALVALAAAAAPAPAGGGAPLSATAAGGSLTAAKIEATLRQSSAAQSAAAALAAVNAFGRYADGAAVVEARFRRPAGLCVLPHAGHSVLVADAGNNYIRLLVSQRALEVRPPALRAVLTPDVVARGHDAAVAARLAAAAVGSQCIAGVVDPPTATTRVTVRAASPRSGDGAARAAAAATAAATTAAAVRGVSPVRSPTLRGEFGAHASAALLGATVPAGFDAAAATHAAPLSAAPPLPPPRELPYGVAFGATVPAAPPPAAAAAAAAGTATAARSARQRTPVRSTVISTRRAPDYSVRSPRRATAEAAAPATAPRPPPFSPSKSFGIGATRRLGDGDPATRARSQSGSRVVVTPAAAVAAAGSGGSSSASRPLGRTLPASGSRGRSAAGGTRVYGAAASLLAAGIDPADAGVLAAQTLLAGDAAGAARAAAAGRSGARPATASGATATRLPRTSAVSADTAFTAAASLLQWGSAASERERSPAARSMAGSRALSRSARSVALTDATSLAQGVPAHVRFADDLTAARHVAAYGAVDSRTALAVEDASAEGQVVKALLLTDALARTAPPTAGGAPSRRVTTASRQLITARFTQHTAASAAAVKASGRHAVRAAPAFVNVASVVSHKLDELRTRVLADGAPPPASWTPAPVGPAPLPRAEDEALVAELRAALPPDMLADVRSALAAAAPPDSPASWARAPASSAGGSSTPHAALIAHLRAAGAAASAGAPSASASASASRSRLF